MKIRSFISIRKLFPSIITLMALNIGVTSVRYAIDGNFHMAIAFLFFAAILDIMDGRVARFFDATSGFGAQLDSLSDMVNFGVVPSIIIYIWSTHFLLNSDLGIIPAFQKHLFWMVLLLYNSCAALRLARFNMQLETVIDDNINCTTLSSATENCYEKDCVIDNENCKIINYKNKSEANDIKKNSENYDEKICSDKKLCNINLLLRLFHKNIKNIFYMNKMESLEYLKLIANGYFFNGVPSTVSGLLVVIPIIITFEICQNYVIKLPILIFYIAMLSFLMVFRIPTMSTKKIKIKKKNMAFVMVLSLMTLFSMIFEPWIMIPIFGFAYFITIPYSFFKCKIKIKKNLDIANR